MIEQKTEAQVEKEITEALILCGFRVLKTSAKRTKGGRGIDKGIPDRLAFIPGANICIGLEIKKSENAKRRPEQVALNESGCYIVAWSVELALSAVCRVLCELDTSNHHIDRVHSNVGRMLDGMGN
jgi:hypothetical protein